MKTFMKKFCSVIVAFICIVPMLAQSVPAAESENISISDEHTLLPDYVMRGDNIYTMFNPEKARFLLGVAQDTYDSENYGKTLRSYGFTSVQFIERGINTTTGEGETAWYNSMTASFGIKKIAANDGTRYVVAIGIQGTSEGSIADILTDANIIKTDGNHLGFYNNAAALVDAGSNVTFAVDEGTITLAQIIEETKKSDSRYSLLITGHSMGAATADMYAAYFLGNAGVLQENFEVYTYAAPLNCSVANRDAYKFNNIFNILNRDDPVVHMVAAKARYGGDIFYTPNEEQRKSCYGDRYKPGEDYNYYAGGILPSTWQPHDSKKTYPVVLESIISDINNYIPNNYESFSGGNEYSIDGFKDFEYNNLTVNNLYTYDKGNMIVRGNLNVVGNCIFNGRVKVDGNVTVSSGAASIEGNMIVGGNYSHAYSAQNTTTTLINQGSVLTVKGDMIQNNPWNSSSNYSSKVYVNGSLYVGGNYNGYGYSNIDLYLNNDSSYMEVTGDFTYSPSGKSANFTKGRIKVGGDYTNNSYLDGTVVNIVNNKDISISSPNLSISGITSKNNITLGYSDDKYIVDIANQTISCSGIIINKNCDFNIGSASLTGNLSIGNLSTANLNGDMTVGGNVGLSAGTVNLNGNMTVCGDYSHAYSAQNTTTTLINQGSVLTVKGDMIQNNPWNSSSNYSSKVYVNGSLYVGGNYNGFGYSNIDLYLNNESSYMEVTGDFTYSPSGKSANFTKGIIKVGGDYTNNSYLGGTVVNIVNNKDISISSPDLSISGITSKNNITLDYSDDKYTVDITNQTISCSGIIINKSCDFNIGSASLTGNLYVGNLSMANLNGDMTVGGNVGLSTGAVNLNGDMTVCGDYSHAYSAQNTTTTLINQGSVLTVKGDMIQNNPWNSSSNYSSKVYVNGSLYVGGNYNGFGYSNIDLYLNNESSYMEVTGDFTYSPSGKSANFTKGIIALGGSYTNSNYLNGTILRLINGQAPITISSPGIALTNLLGDYTEAVVIYDGYNYDFDFNNSSMSFKSLSGSKDTVFNNITSITGEIMTINNNLEIYCDNAEITGNVAVGSGGNVVLEGDYTVNGDYTMTGNGTTTINQGSSLTVMGNVIQSGSSSALSELYVLGTLSVSGNYEGNSYSKLAMQLRDSKMEVLGDFTYNGSGNYMTKGSLDVGGSFSSKNPIRTTVTTDLKTVAYNISIVDSEGVIISDHTDTANFADKITININNDKNRKYYIFIKDVNGNVIKQGIGGTYVFSMPNKDIVISAGYVGFETGDVDKNGSVSDVDGVIVLRHISGISVLADELRLALADVNNNGIVDICDVASIMELSDNATSDDTILHTVA